MAPVTELMFGCQILVVKLTWGGTIHDSEFDGKFDGEFDSEFYGEFEGDDFKIKQTYVFRKSLEFGEI